MWGGSNCVFSIFFNEGRMHVPGVGIIARPSSLLEAEWGLINGELSPRERAREKEERERECKYSSVLRETQQCPVRLILPKNIWGLTE